MLIKKMKKMPKPAWRVTWIVEALLYIGQICGSNGLVSGGSSGSLEPLNFSKGYKEPLIFSKIS